jgi:cation:H+ antiporter
MQGLVLTVLAFLFGLALLVKGADWLVSAAARIARQFGLSEFVIGLTIVATGTVMPEVGASVTAAIYGNSGIAIGNIVGSNIANLALILGLAGLFAPIAVDKEMYGKIVVVMVASGLLFLLFCLNGLLSRMEGIILLLLFFVYLAYFISTKKTIVHEKKISNYLHEYADLIRKERIEQHGFSGSLWRNVRDGRFHYAVYGIGFFLTGLDEAVKAEFNAIRFFLKQLFFIAIGAVCVFFGANLLVKAASTLPINQWIIGVVFVSVGTSLPEIAVAITSLRKGVPAIMVGNLIGSNISDVFLVGGLASIANPISFSFNALLIDFLFFVGISWLFLVFLRNNYKIERIESFTLVIIYCIFLVITFVRV